MDGKVKYYEGCGQEGPIRCIFLCEFHPTAGPKITCQVPENYISKDIFDTVSHYIIPKVQLQRCTLTVTLLGSKILGFPVRIDNKKYARNAYYFNLCFVCDAWARTVHLEPLVKKLTEYLLSMELETEWLSKQSISGEAKALGGLMRQVMQDINSRRMCTLTVGTTTTHLTVVRVNSDPTPVKDHQVPVFLYSRHSFVADQWDLTTNQENTDDAQNEENTDNTQPSDPEPSLSEPRKKRSKISQLSTIVSSMKDMQYDLSKSETVEDEFDIFGKHIAKQLRTLSTEQAILGQEEIQSVITKCRLHDLKYGNMTANNPKYFANTHAILDWIAGLE
ncbi:GATOR complex protein NPRL2 isoform X2 [Spodoptera frugiperda]|uniref:GATOR complex protein NPRL2 isoform X2 n=1 Tax=Spodoptera frugiperda TaxID=7108 RepID=A0A9R0E5G0_SPOFR|nr:GATOR complex protein NPRL2 isoform X2 [Spodoptera frugiperda]